jgi:uncharacterized protein YdeI (YjbR/CyaY-like superfamily)
MPKIVVKSFTARVELLRSNLRWVIAFIPFDTKKTWGSGGMPKVRGEINGFPFRTSLFPIRKGGHFLLVNKKMQAGAKVRPGEVAKIRLENDVEERTVTVPPELEREFKQSKALRKWFDALNYSTRREICAWTAEPKSVEAKKRRAEQMAERLFSVMEAEREMPPVLQAAFARRPRALRGWERMSPSHKRQHLLGIFGYRTPESRTRRIDKTIEAAEAVMDKLADKE